MSTNQYIETVFLDFFDIVMQGKIILQDQDKTASAGFYNLISLGKPLTEKQGKFLIKILDKYQKKSVSIGLDYSENLRIPIWKRPFRVIDETKSVSVEKDESGKLWVIIKLPYALKEKLESLFNHDIIHRSSYWDTERQVRKFDFYRCNLIQLNEFFIEHGFIRDETFLYCLSEIEEIWNNYEDIVPSSKVVNGRVELVNAPLDAVDWWLKSKTGNLEKDLFLAKTSGFPLKAEKSPDTLIEKIASSFHNYFRIKDLPSFFEIYKIVNDKVAIVVNKDSESLHWIKKFSEHATFAGIPPSEIKVCFRLGKDEDKGFNQWIKDNGHGGAVDTGSIFIFQGKPAKWLFSDENNVKLIVTNSPYPIPSSTMQDWMNSHPCVLFIGDMKVSHLKDKNLVEL